MNLSNLVILGILLIAWLGILGYMLLNRDGKLPGLGNNSDLLLPVGVTLTVWMWIFAVVIFSI